jgi:hypothetical protein
MQGRRAFLVSRIARRLACPRRPFQLFGGDPMRRLLRRRWTRLAALLSAAAIGATALIVVVTGSASASSLNAYCHNYAHQQTGSPWHGNAFYYSYNYCMSHRPWRSR